ncbi:MAG: hypothetical protein QHH07_02535 [Sedimentisphaerales bacterium]|nr:hypothetical protein [Sedimentisphaerales bacterium]
MYTQLGPTYAIRSVRQFTTGFGNYNEQRDGLLGDNGLDNIARDIESLRK